MVRYGYGRGRRPNSERNDKSYLGPAKVGELHESKHDSFIKVDFSSTRNAVVGETRDGERGCTVFPVAQLF